MRLWRMRFVALGAVFVFSGVLVSGAASGASGRPLPKALATTRCAHPCQHPLVGVYRVRPKVIQMIEADGGALHIHWTHWSHRRARGHGTSVVHNMGGVDKSRIRVLLSRVRAGRFTRMRVTFRNSSGRYVGRFSLGTAYDNPSWIRNEDCGNADLDSYCD